MAENKDRQQIYGEKTKERKMQTKEKITQK